MRLRTYFSQVSFTLLISLLLLIPAYAQADLGVPCIDKTWYARNIWDMILFDGQLFIGCGDSTGNAGPVDVWAYSQEAGWRSEFVVDEEQIDKFLVLNGVLTIPGDDPLESWDYGNYYQRINGMWVKTRNIPGGVHVYDIIEWENRWIAGIGINPPSNYPIAISVDHGASWSVEVVPQGATAGNFDYDCSLWITMSAFRVYEFFTIGDNLYANTLPMYSFGCDDGEPARQNLGTLTRWAGDGFVVDDLDLFPGLSAADRIVRPVSYREMTTYIAAQTIDNPNKWQPLALMSVDNNLQPRPISLSNCARPQDIDVLNGKLYVLCNEHTGSDWYISVQATCDMLAWEEAVNLTTPTFARSFAISSESVYVGLGGDIDAPVHAQTAVGQVLTIPVSATSGCP